MEITTDNIHQNLPALYTIDGRQYEIVTATVRYDISPFQPRPAIPVNIGVAYGEGLGDVVPVNENPFNLFLITPKPIIPLSFLYLLEDANGIPNYQTDSPYYCVANGTGGTNRNKTISAQSKIQYLMSFNFQTPTAFPFDFKIMKDDFFLLEYGERILWPGFKLFTPLEYRPATNSLNYLFQNPLAAGTQYYTNCIFTYLQLM